MIAAAPRGATIAAGADRRPLPASPAPTAVVLAGGLGTRLRPVVADRQKAVAPVACRPFLANVLERLAVAGIDDVVLAVGHLAGTVRAACGDGRAFGVGLRYAEEPVPLGTAGAIRHAAARVHTDPFLVLNGDTLAEVDLDDLLRYHQVCQATLTIALATVPDRARFGTVEVDRSGRVTGFAEKAGAGPGWVSAGIYVVAWQRLEQWFEALATGDRRPVSLERELLPRLVGHGLFGFRAAGTRFLDIGTPATLAAADRALATGTGHG